MIIAGIVLSIIWTAGLGYGTIWILDILLF